MSEQNSKVLSASLGFPRIGARRELKTALEKFWNGDISESDLLSVGRQIRVTNWRIQADAGLDIIPSNDFSFYDHVLDTIAMVGAVPKRFGWTGGKVDLKTYFLMARGQSQKHGGTNGSLAEAPAMEMTKWFNSNYHFIVPELEDDQEFSLASTKVVDEFVEARAAGIHTRPVLLGPVTFLYLAKGHSISSQTQTLKRLLDVYERVLLMLREAGADWVQIDEPCLSCDLNTVTAAAFSKAYNRLSQTGVKIMLTTYFDSLGPNLSIPLSLPVHGLHLDFVNGAEDLEQVLERLPESMILSAGVIDGHNVWRADLRQKLNDVQRIVDRLGAERVIVAPSCSMLHVPIDVSLETKLNPEVYPWLAFARQKLDELSVLTKASSADSSQAESALRESDAVKQSAAQSKLRHDVAVETRRANITSDMLQRVSPFPKRAMKQNQKHGLPLFPTTTIGSFPQTKEIREARKKLKNGTISQAEYDREMQQQIQSNISIQQEIGLDVFVHGEPERTDMVEYFAELLDGMEVTQHGWVQSYGSRCVRPPIIFGSVARRNSMTTRWASLAQSFTSKPVKGMLTGPVTILQWSFVRDDQPRASTCMEIAIAIRDEVSDLERSGISIIQIDEPAIREGLPLKRANWNDYLEWAVECFQAASTGVSDETQIHTHMCYSEFGEMIDAIAAMDADVISIEASRSKMDLLDALHEFRYPNAIGPGVYDIHSPRVPSVSEMEALLSKALAVIPPERLWVNPDCGLKTRHWDEVVPALNALVQAASALRARHTLNKV